MKAKSRIIHHLHKLCLPRNMTLRHVVLLFGAFTSMSIGQTTVVLDAVADNTIYEENGNSSNGSGNYIFAGQNNRGENRRALIKFDVSSIPAAATITQVSLNIQGSRGGPDDVSVHKVYADWGEATSTSSGGEGGGGPALTGDATWIYTFHATQLWSIAGGDFDPAQSAMATVNPTSINTWSSTKLRADVQSWIDGSAANYGWIMVGDETTFGSAVRMNAKDGGINTPELSVSYTTPSLCEDYDNLTGMTPSGTYQANRGMTITGLISSPSDVTISAGQHIELLPVFSVEKGAELLVVINACQ